MGISQSLFLSPSYIWCYLHLPAPWEHTLLAKHFLLWPLFFTDLSIPFSQPYFSEFAHFSLYSLPVVSYLTYDFTSLQSISSANIFLGLQFHTSNHLMFLSLYMSHRHWRDLKSICVPHWARGATSHVTVKVSFTGGSEQWSMSWLRPSTPTLIHFIRLRTKTPRKKTLSFFFFFCYTAFDFISFHPKKETESPQEKVKRKKRQGTATALKVTFHGPSKLGQRSAGMSPSLTLTHHSNGCLFSSRPGSGKRHHSAHIFEFPTKIKYQAHT